MPVAVTSATASSHGSTLTVTVILSFPTVPVTLCLPAAKSLSQSLHCIVTGAIIPSSPVTLTFFGKIGVLPSITVYSLSVMDSKSKKTTLLSLPCACCVMADSAVSSIPTAAAICVGVKLTVKVAANKSEFAFFQNFLTISFIPF